MILNFMKCQPMGKFKSKRVECKLELRIQTGSYDISSNLKEWNVNLDNFNGLAEAMVFKSKRVECKYYTDGLMGTLTATFKSKRVECKFRY